MKTASRERLSVSLQRAKGLSDATQFRFALQQAYFTDQFKKAYQCRPGNIAGCWAAGGSRPERSDFVQACNLSKFNKTRKGKLLTVRKVSAGRKSVCATS